MPDEAIHPFTLSIPQSSLDDLQTLLRLTRWPDKEPVNDWSQGVPLATIQDLCIYWQNSYDWRRCESLLNSYPQFTTHIDGLDIYFLHFRSKHAGALPLLLTHGWPGSVLEFRHVIDKLIDPESGDPADAFHLVIPALPGYAFSSKPKEAGWDFRRVARAWEVLMERLGYADGERGWVAQGGDWGAHVTAWLGHMQAKGLRGVHFNSVYLDAKKESKIPIKDTKGLELAMQKDRIRDGGHYGYHTQQSTRPQTLGYGLASSPVAQAAWILEKLHAWTDVRLPISSPPFPADETLDNIMLYWLSNSGTSSARFYWENAGIDHTGWEVGVPVGVSMFKGDTVYVPREWAERYYGNVVWWKEVEKGGHFAAWENPGGWVGEVRGWGRVVRGLNG